MSEMKEIAKELAKMGRYGDTMLAHINPQEAAILKMMGGAGTLNPYTGLPEFWDPWKDVKKAAKKIGKSVEKAATSVVKELKKQHLLF